MTAQQIREKLEWFELRRLREFLPRNGCNHNNIKLQVGANGQEVLNWPSGGADDDCSPILETVTIDVDWDFDEDPSDSTGDQAGLDSVDKAVLSVHWGTVAHRADFDLMNGTSVTVSGYKVGLKASYPRADPILVAQRGLVYIPQPTINLRASLAQGTKQYGGIVGNARFTIDLGTITGGGTSTRVQIPYWAKEIGIANDQIAVPTMTIDQYGNANNAAVTRWRGSVGKGGVDTVPRESYSSWVDVTNTSQVSVATRIIFYLGR